MRLYLDDRRDIPAGWMGARTVAEAITQAKAMHSRDMFDECSLDHDLGWSCDTCRSFGKSWCEHPGGCGLDFIDWMIESGVWPKKKPVVHSMNPSGARRMRQAIERYYVAPPVPEEGPKG